MARKCQHTLFALLLVLICVQTVHADTFSASEVKLKIALLYNFAKFVDWPEHRFQASNAPITLCIYAEEEYSEAANSVANKPVQKNRVISVVRITNESTLNECHILFLSQTVTFKLGKIPEPLVNSSILTVGESNDFIQYGGIINLIEINNQLRFEINLKAAEAQSLKISSKLLRLAKEVY